MGGDPKRAERKGDWQGVGVVSIRGRLANDSVFPLAAALDAIGLSIRELVRAAEGNGRQRLPSKIARGAVVAPLTTVETRRRLLPSGQGLLFYQPL